MMYLNFYSFSFLCSTLFQIWNTLLYPKYFTKAGVMFKHNGMEMDMENEEQTTGQNWEWQYKSHVEIQD